MTSALLAFLFAFKPFFFDAVPTQPGPEPLVRASVVIETSTLREAGAGPAIASRVKRSATAALRAVSIGDDGGPSDPVLAVTVRPLGGQAIGYTSTIAVRKDGRQISHSRQRCSLCTEGELVARVERSLVRLAPKLRQIAGE